VHKEKKAANKRHRRLMTKASNLSMAELAEIAQMKGMRDLSDCVCVPARVTLRVPLLQAPQPARMPMVPRMQVRVARMARPRTLTLMLPKAAVSVPPERELLLTLETKVSNAVVPLLQTFF